MTMTKWMIIKISQLLYSVLEVLQFHMEGLFCIYVNFC